MKVIFVVGSVACDAADVESDPWIPLKVSWWPRGPRQPLYLRVSGSSGGEIELKVDPANGALIQIVVIDAPPVVEAGVGAGFVPALEAKRTAVLDVSEWSGDGTIRETVSRLSLIHGHGAVEVRFDDALAASRLQCDDVAVDVSADGALVSVRGAVQAHRG